TVFERIKRIHDDQQNVMWKRRTKQKSKTKESQNKINTGDVVLYKNQQRTGKLDPKWIGPYIVQATAENGSAIITDANQTKDIIAHNKDIKKILKVPEYEKYQCKHEFKQLNDANKKENKLEIDKKKFNFEKNKNNPENKTKKFINNESIDLKNLSDMETTQNIKDI
ncbi:hypothetical protein COBT_003553, partial [Conglomerata obtusa]